MHIVRRSAFKAVPWRNGGGITHEVMRLPAAAVAAAAAEAFCWRVSVAQIDASGPFSEYADHHRIMVLLRGSGVRLAFSGGETATLREVGDCVEFDGALTTRCELLDGPCSDLNLMVSKAWTARTRVLRLTEPVMVGEAGATLPEGSASLLFTIAGAISVHGDTAGVARLDEWDFALAEPDERLLLAPASAGAAASAGSHVVFCATVVRS